jgi:long-chain acyl-CoA synthetase
MDDLAFEALGLRPPDKRVHPAVGPRDVASIIDAAVRDTPDAEALVDPETRHSYATLDRAIDGAAQLFISLGIGMGDRLAACLPNSCDIVIAFMASQRIGAIWVGVSRILPPSDKAYILSSSGALLMITDTAVAAEICPLRDALPNLSHLIVLDDDADVRWQTALASDCATPLPRPEIDPFAPATIMYTSGTTGVPKGVVHSQHNMVVLCAAGSSEGHFVPKGRRGVALPLTITNLMILGPLYAFWNGTACACGQSIKTAALLEWIRAERVSLISAVPTMVYDILQSDEDLPDDFELGAGGAAVPVAMQQAYRARYGKNLLLSYGLTEAPTVVADSRFLDSPEGACGLAMSHMEITIRNADGECLATGEIGEICVAPVKHGKWADLYTPALGYWQDKDKTAKLLQNGVLHTGDLGQLDAQGWLYLADRSSELILRGGSNVYPAEIERVLHTHGHVADCAIVGKPDLRMGMTTVAFIQPAREIDKADLIAELSSLCAASLSRYKVPDQWIIVETFPRNAMGKIVKPALREMLVGEADQTPVA